MSKPKTGLISNRKIILLFAVVTTFFALVALYRVFFTPVTFDEVNYLLKGQALVSGTFKPYELYGFYTGYPPLAYWFTGLTQIMGPNILLARVSSYILLIGIFLLTILIGYRLGGKKTAIISSLFLAFSLGFSRLFIQLPVYPQSAILILLSVFLLISNSKNKLFHLIAIILLTLASYIRLQALFTYFVVVLFLLIQEKSNFYRAFLVIFAFLAVIILALPFYPEILRLFVQIPAFGLFPPSHVGVHSLQLSPFYKDFTLARKIFSIYRFFAYYSSYLFLSAFLLTAFLWIKRKNFSKLILTFWPPKNGILIVFIVLVNTLGVLIFSFFSLCPSCSINYLSLILPLITLTLSLGIVSLYQILKNSESKIVFSIIVLFSLLWTAVPTPYHQLDFPYIPPPIITVVKTAKEFSQQISKDENLFALGAQQYLYPAGLQTFRPLINGLYTFRDSPNSDELLKYGYWNKDLAVKWLKESQWALIDERFYDDLQRGGENTRDLLNELKATLENNFHPVARIAGQSGEKITLYQRIN